MANPSTVLVFILISILFLVEVVDSDNFPWCPAVVDGCYCRRKYNTDDIIYCENLGALDRVPRFNQSDMVFKEMHFRYNTQITLIQKNAFVGLQVQQLWLQSLNASHVDKDAFINLGDSLTHLNMDDNSLRTIHRNVFLPLRNLQFLGLHNNLMTSVPTLASSRDSFPHLNYFYLFNNFIREIPLNTFRGMGSLKGVKLNNNQITSLQTGVFDSLVELNELELQGNRLATLPGNIFRNLNELMKLDLSHNRIHLLLTEAFYGLRHLVVLHLNHNMLRGFQSGMFTHISRIKYLTLSYNHATNIEQSTFRKLRNIRTLDLSFNRISRIETKSFRFLYRLQKLYLRGNELKHLDFFFQSLLGKIEILDVSKNNLTQLVDSRVFSSLAKLEQLNLGENKIGNLIPGVFRELRLLRILKMAGNPFYMLRQGVLDHLHLEEVDMTHCHLRRIHDKAFATISNINYLWLDNNEIEDIPTRLFNNTKNLNILSMKNNSLKVLRREMFKGLTRLESLHLDGNNLTNITEYSFVFLGNIRTLTMSHNNISQMFEHSFNDLKSLLTLDLSHNKITSIGRAFTRFQNIENIILKGNQLSNVNWFSFFYSSLKKLKLLDLSYCSLGRVSLQALLRSLITPLEEFRLNLVGNPFSCQGCDLAWSSYVPYNSIISPIDVICNAPDQYRGMPVLCCLDNPCMAEAIKNNSNLRTMCSEAEARLLAQTTTTESSQNSSSMETTSSTSTEISAATTAATTPDNLTFPPEDNSTTFIASHSLSSPATDGFTFPENVTEEITESTTIYPLELESSSDERTNPPVNVTESEIGSGEVDEDWLMNVQNVTIYDDSNEEAGDTAQDQKTSITATTTATTTLFALLVNGNIETTTRGDVTPIDDEEVAPSREEEHKEFSSHQSVGDEVSAGFLHNQTDPSPETESSGESPDDPISISTNWVSAEEDQQEQDGNSAESSREPDEEVVPLTKTPATMETK